MSKKGHRYFQMNLKKLRECRGMTISQVCLVLNISRLSYTPWEESDGFPRATIAVRLCNLFGYYDLYRMCAEDLKFRQDGKDLLVNNQIYTRL